MKQFESDKQLACWAGLAPANNESANKKKSVRISKAGQYLKPLLVQCALGAIKDKEGYFGIKYSRIKRDEATRKPLSNCKNFFGVIPIDFLWEDI